MYQTSCLCTLYKLPSLETSSRFWPQYYNRARITLSKNLPDIYMPAFRALVQNPYSMALDNNPDAYWWQSHLQNMRFEEFRSPKTFLGRWIALPHRQMLGIFMLMRMILYMHSKMKCSISAPKLFYQWYKHTLHRFTLQPLLLRTAKMRDWSLCNTS